MPTNDRRRPVGKRPPRTLWAVEHVDGEIVYLSTRTGVLAEIARHCLPRDARRWRRLAAGRYCVLSVWRTANGLRAGVLHLTRVRREAADRERTMDRLPFDKDSLADDVVRRHLGL